MVFSMIFYKIFEPISISKAVNLFLRFFITQALVKYQCFFIDLGLYPPQEHIDYLSTTIITFGNVPFGNNIFRWFHL